MATRSRPKKYSRPVAPFDWLILARPREFITDVQLCVEGDGALDPSELSAAVAAAAQACPGARLIRRGNRWVDSGRAPAVRVVNAADFDRTLLDSPLLRAPLASGSKDSCEVLLLRGTPSTVIFRASHAVMDGHGAMFWQKQVFRALRGEAVEQALCSLTGDEVRAEVAAKLGFGAPQEAPPPEPEWRPLLGKLPAGPRRSIWRRRTIDGTHPAVTAKIARQVATYGGGKGGLIQMPVDMRQFLPELRTTGGAGGLVKVRVHEDGDWEDVHASLLTALSEHQYLTRSGNTGILEMPLPLLRGMTRWLDDMAVKNEENIRQRRMSDHIALISHLGTVNLADFCANGFEATSYYSLGSVWYSPELNVVETRGKTEVTIAGRDGPGVAEHMEALLDHIESKLSPRGGYLSNGSHIGHEESPATLTRLFARQVSLTPEAVAVSSPEGDVTYAELSRHAAAIAATLRAHGLGRNDRIGLVADRSYTAIAAIWGILKAGAAYLPIDASYPDARIIQILSDAGAPICLLESPGEPRDCIPVGCEGISLDTIVRTEPGSWHDVAGEPGDLACVIYTSGSTGEPKGVEIEHGSLVNYVRWVTREADINAATRMPLVASISFDMAGCAIFLPLLAGGTVLPVREVNAVTLREVLDRGGVNVMAITPSHLELINQLGTGHREMRVVMTAGELLRRSTALRARQIFGPQCRILCQWGPTETTIVNTSHEFDPDTDTEPGVPFGRPMDNNTVYLMDSHGRFVPPGEPGEAYVAGIQVARGYLGRPDLTRERFIRLADGTRVYRTGDIARLLPTGELAFVRRADDQVKVAGHRIEPAEVVRVLEEHPAVRQAAVLAHVRPGRDDKELCGYVVCGSRVAEATLKKFIAGRLPQYMVPAAIIEVPEMPRNSNGKTDLRQLPNPFVENPADDAATADCDDITAAVTKIWARMLQVDANLLDEQADFHLLGGNSILLLSMINEVSQSVGEQAREELMGELIRIIREPTLGRVSELAREVRVKHLTRQGA